MIVVLVSVQPMQASHQVAKKIRLTIGFLCNRVLSLFMFSAGNKLQYFDRGNMHKLCSSHVFLHCNLEQNVRDLCGVGYHSECGFELSAPQHRSIHTTGAAWTFGALTQLSTHKSKTGPRSAVQSTQPAHLSRLIRPELHFYPFETSHIYLDTSQIHTQLKLSAVRIWQNVHTVCEAARKHPQLPTWTRA